jgi:kynurenine formamidase
MKRLLLIAGLIVGCRPPEPPADPAQLAALRAAGTWIDLSYGFDSTTIYWPTAQPFQLEVISAQRTAAGYYYAANNIAAAEHGGTHLDAPIHFAEGKWTTDQIPLDRLIGPAVVVDVSAAVTRTGADYLVAARDFTDWEAAHGALPEGAIVLVRTGWGARWPDRARYLGTTKTGQEAAAELHFPGIAPEAARWLLGRQVHAVGIDTPSLDYGQSNTFETHVLLLGENIPGLENLANLDQLPATGAFVIALPMKISGGSGGPLRIVAWIPD